MITLRPAGTIVRAQVAEGVAIHFEAPTKAQVDAMTRAWSAGGGDQVKLASAALGVVARKIENGAGGETILGDSSEERATALASFFTRKFEAHPQADVLALIHECIRVVTDAAVIKETDRKNSDGPSK